MRAVVLRSHGADLEMEDRPAPGGPDVTACGVCHSDRRYLHALGAGGLGQFAVQYLRKLTDAQVHVGDTSSAKCERAVTRPADVTT